MRLHPPRALPVDSLPPLLSFGSGTRAAIRLPSLRMDRPLSPRPWLQFRIRTFFVGTAVIAALLLTVVLIPQVLSRQARLQVLRTHVGEVARLAASQVDGDVHRALVDGTQADDQTRHAALEPLLHLHAAWPEA